MSNGHLSGQVRGAAVSRSALIYMITPLRLRSLHFLRSNILTKPRPIIRSYFRLLPISHTQTANMSTTKQIRRITLFKIPTEEGQEKLLNVYRTMPVDAKKVRSSTISITSPY